ncbi:uncharacterized protein LOC123672495 [Harmonia axyridis]|uniref:uncharacterized protein LOC123672495 n=1 Tax=Harmonia axyridis TaxID=115357 RepID=UPI001E2768A0|nr:uncharacterized protein LOC123672495 [Harmonia axyridis]
MGFMEDIKHRYGMDILRNFKQWANQVNKRASLENHRKFLLRCRKQRILPSHITRYSKCISGLILSNSPFANHCYSALTQFQFRVLNIEICFYHWKLRQIKHNIEIIKSKLRNEIAEDILFSFSVRQNKFYNFKFHQIRSKQMTKFNNLMNVQVPSNLKSTPDKWIMNFSDLSIPNNVKCFLSLGHQFNLPYTNSIPVMNIIVDCERVISKHDFENRDLVRARVVNTIMNFLNSNQYSRSYSPSLCRDLRDTRAFLSNNKDHIVVLRADKGNVTVVMNRDEYSKKCTELLDDSQTYEKLESDPTVRVQNKNNRFVKILLNKDLVPEPVAKKLTSNDGIFPKMYFLPKIHKTGIPMRPILSFVGSPIYELSKFIADLLKPIFIKDEHYVRNSFDFFNSTNKTRLPPNYVLLSLDVVSLYTNTPTDLALQIIEENWNMVSDPSFDSETFKLIYNFLITSSYFCFNGQFYRQIFGFGMGNCVSQICCDIVMVKLQDYCLSRLPFSVPIFKRYVDDIFTSVPVNTEQLVLDTFNSFHPKLQFTLELESKSALNFLDMRVERTDDNVLYVDWYHKPTFSGRYIGFHSHHAMIHKVNIIRNLKFRALNLSDKRYHEKNLKKIRSILLNNSCPAHLINKILGESLKPSLPQIISSEGPSNTIL